MAKQNPPSAQKRFQDKFPDVQFDWNETYSLSFNVSLETKIREFQHKVLNNIVWWVKSYLKLRWLIRHNVPYAKQDRIPWAPFLLLQNNKILLGNAPFLAYGL